MSKKAFLNVLAILVIIAVVILMNFPKKIMVDGEYAFCTIKEAAGIKFVERGSVLITVDSQKNLTSFCYHEIWFDKELNCSLGKIGAMTYILDSNGRPISKGYHELFLKGDQIYGKVGATTESVKIQ